MSDKILTEAFDKLKAIEESDDPFCIGEGNEEEVVDEAEEQLDEDFEQPKVYQIDTNHGDNYAIHFQDNAGKEEAFVEVNGITVATYTVGGAGAMDARIKDPAEVLNALTHALHAANGSEGT